MRRKQPTARGMSIAEVTRDRKSTRLNSSHGYKSYAVFCLKKNKKNTPPRHLPQQQRSQDWTKIFRVWESVETPAQHRFFLNVRRRRCPSLLPSLRLF